VQTACHRLVIAILYSFVKAIAINMARRLRIVMKRVDDFRLRLGDKQLVPIMVGGMGVDISTAELALEAARLGGIGHISDAMVPDVSDRRFDTSYVKDKTKLYKFNIANADKTVIQFDLGLLAEATHLHVGKTMEAKRGDGMIFVNCMEKLTMNGPRETLRTRLVAALDAGIDGITLKTTRVSVTPSWASSCRRCAPCRFS